MTIRILETDWDRERDVVARLFREYVDSLNQDIQFQNVEEELATLPGKYARPKGGAFLARDGAEYAAVVAFRPLAPKTCEMKRLFVRPAYRGLGLGERLARTVIAKARATGYRRIVLDTLSTMQSAKALYARLGFEQTAPYYDNPLRDTVYLALDLGDAIRP